MYRSEDGLFYALEVLLREAKEPLTCVQIYEESAKIRDLAKNPNRVSDYLGGLWRKGLVKRGPAPRIGNSSARWAYSWNEAHDESGKHNAQADDFVSQFRGGDSVYKRPNVEIFDDGKSIKIELPDFTITVRHKR